MKTWGKHLVIDAGVCNAEIKNSDAIYRFVKQLVIDIDMVAYGEPQIVHFGSGNKAGYTLVQLIETSNIVAHFNEEDMEIYLDVFSCKDFNPQVVIKLVEDYFGAQTIVTQVIERQALKLQ